MTLLLVARPPLSPEQPPGGMLELLQREKQRLAVAAAAEARSTGLRPDDPNTAEEGYVYQDEVRVRAAVLTVRRAKDPPPPAAPPSALLFCLPMCRAAVECAALIPFCCCFR